MKKNFVGLRNFFEDKYPELRGNIHGDTYPPPLYATSIATLTSYIWMGGIAVLMFGDQIFGALGMPVPDLVKKMSENKPVAFFALFVINNIGSSLVSTGAFEIYVNDDLIFSKLQTGRFPTLDELMAAVDAIGLQKR